MMAHDEVRGPGARALSAETLDRFREAAWLAWNEPVRSGDEGPGDAALRDAVAAIAGEARLRALRAEELLVAFKGVLEELAERRGAELRSDARAFQARLVTLCIKAYYAA